MKKYTLITGGASGLGLELSKRFAKDKNDLVLISSNINNLNSAKEMLEKEYGIEVKVLALDLSDNKNFPLVKEFVEKNDIRVNNLVNCAGFGDCHDFKDMDIDRQIRMVELNCNCPMYLTRLFINDMIEQKEGHILDINSIAAFFPGPFMSTYHASKIFFLYMSESIERELKGTGVKVTRVCPGPFSSDFVNKAQNFHTFSKMKPISTEKVADITYKAFKKNKSTKIIGFKSKLMIFASRFAPRKFIINTSAKQIKKDA